MKNKLLLLSGMLLGAGASFGQTGDIYSGEAFRFSEIQQTGTARFRGLGGNQAALGGDASSLFGNPAGLGFYNRSEISISPTLNLNSSQASFLGSSLSENGAKFSVGQLGLIFAGGDNGNRRWRRTTFGVGYHQNINYFNRFTFQGRNNRSSFVDPIILDANARNVTGSQIDAEYDPNTNQATDLLAAAYQLFLVNGSPIGQNDSGAPFSRFDANRPRDQRNTFESTGSQSQWTFAYAGNLDDKLYLGVNVGLSSVRYNSENVLTEFIVNGQTFDNYSQRDRLTVRGNGFNLSVGAIYKLTPELQLGATVATPTFMSIRETFNQGLSVVARDPALPLIGNAVDVYPNDFNYSITSPFRASGGATVFLGKGKIGFLTASAEYVGYGGIRANTTNNSNAQANSDFRNDVRNSVQTTYQNVINFRGGAEFRAGQFRIRGGAAYLPDPYISRLDNIDRSRLLLSGGVGLRNERFFADVSGTYNTFKSAFTPYTLPNSADYGSAQITNNNTNVTLSVGTFF
ncbi:hypothetical protein [Spirosoma sordidisoli]|uniref:Aromatic hydrocarbon degradation protein n=1 Tax=Spirosoma sordidisoli TaxID=2502893 RepID=A0A4Q2UJW5_9BACT|nr:hypothetical protein [Spirosoma sordidisoli]RYC69544.1 hypothetical protein EQG79_13135 [Spirosoma sordidisoli]